MGSSMKKLLFAILFVSSSAAAQPHFYVGGGLLIGNETEWDDTLPGGVLEDGTNKLGYSVVAGIAQPTKSFIDFGVNLLTALELEYQDYGAVEFTNVNGSGQSLSVNGYSIFFNSRIKIFEKTNRAYLGFLGGVGFQNAHYESSLLPDRRVNESGAVYQLGVAVGTQLSRFDLSFGYRYQYTDFDGIDLSMKGLTTTLLYNF